jgi:hypothetical protein
MLKIIVFTIIINNIVACKYAKNIHIKSPHIKEINRKIYEVEHLVNQNIKLKTEMGISSGAYWKKTRNNFSKISERLNRISSKIRQLGA